MDPLLAALTQFGLPGVMLAVMLYLFVKKDAELKRESAARIDDSKAYTKGLLEVQERALGVAEKLSDIFEETRRQYPPRRSG